jgi:sigma-B regulation protein RsbU (phosphoserine phosphatase)
MTRARILVVDDEPAMLRSVARILEGTYDVASAPSPSEAIALIAAFKPDLAIVDVRMPEMDGFELMARLKAVRPDLDLILMTGSTETESKLVRAIRERAFYFIQKPFDREVLLTLVARCLELRKLAEENRRHVGRLEGELREARTFQKSLLPPEESKVEGLAIAARYLPCSELGGDFYDYASAGRGRTTVLIADVSGHGASAAMLTGIVKAAFRSAQTDAYEPSAVIGRISASLRDLADHMMVTAFCARFTREERMVEYVNAGHPPGILIRDDGEHVLLASTGPLISPVFPNPVFEQKTMRLGAAQSLLLYTDGIVEAQADSQEFGLPALLALVDRREAREARETRESHLLDAILAAVRAHLGPRPAADDMTLLAAKWAAERKKASG